MLSKRISALEAMEPKITIPVALVFPDYCSLKGKRFNSEAELDKEVGTCFKIYANNPKGEELTEL